MARHLLPLLLLSASAASAAPPLARLADAFAVEAARAARGRAIELAAIDDRVGGLAPDLQSLLRERLAPRLTLSSQGPRLRVEPVLTQVPGRLVLSARVTALPEGQVVDLLSVSVDADREHLALQRVRSPAGRALDVLDSTRTPPLESAVLDVAWLDDQRLAVLFPDALAVYRLDPGGLVLEARAGLEAPLTARRATGRVLAAEGSLWALTNRAGKARLFGFEGRRLVPRAEAAALPWPGCPSGLRYRIGTDVLEAAAPCPAASLAVVPGAWVDPDGGLHLDGTATALRVGPTLAPLWPGLLATSSAEPPSSDDTLLVLATDTGRLVETLSGVSGAVRALAARVRDDSVRLAAGIEEPAGANHVLLMELRKREP